MSCVKIGREKIMYKKRSTRYILFAVMILVLAAIVSACGRSKMTDEKVVTVVSEPTVGIIAEEQTVEKPATESPPTETPLPTELPPPTELPTEPPSTPIPEPIRITDFGFGQEEDMGENVVGYAFIVKNPNQELVFEKPQYQVTAYDEEGIVVATDSRDIGLLFPGQTLGIGGEMFPDEGVKVAKIEVQFINEGEVKASEPAPPFTVDDIAFQKHDYYTGVVTGKVTNLSDVDLSGLKVSAVIYDEAGNIIGGGWTFMTCLAANNSAGLLIPVARNGEIASIELYPTLAKLQDDSGTPEGASDIQLLNFGYGQDNMDVGVGLLFKNPNGDYALEDSQYHVTLYSDEGAVLSADGDFISGLLLPGQTVGLAVPFHLPESDNIHVDHVAVQIKSGGFVEAKTGPSFTYENIAFQPDSDWPTVTGVVVSPCTNDITNQEVSAIAYDENGKIVGGGNTYLDFIPANGKAEVEVHVTVVGVPSKVELYARIISLSACGK